MTEIGETLRDARMRARIDVSEIEAKTKIRAKYLRALENEEWGLLPGPTFVKSFLRTYATALGLDGKALVEEYRLHHERSNEALEPIVSGSHRTRGRAPGGGRVPGGPSRTYMAAVAVVAALIVVLIVALLAGGSGSSKSTADRSSSTALHNARHRHSERASGQRRQAAAGTTSAAIVALSLRPSARVYVCLIGDNGRKVIPGEELAPGTTTHTFHAKRFEITLGNSSVTMFVDGKARTVPASSQAIGYTITRAYGRKRLPEGRLPTCM
jgi:cytoskeletal protein RodZ